MLHGVRDRIVDGQPQPGGQPEDDHRRRRYQRHVQIGVDAHRVVGGAVEQFGDVDRDVVVEGGQLALGEPFDCREGGLDARLRPDDVVEHLLALLLGHVEGGQHLEVGPHGREWGAQLVRRHRGEVAGGHQGRLGAVLLLPDALHHAVHRLGDLNRLGGSPYLDVRCVASDVDGPRLLS